jgi:hypothetical protein
MTKIDVVHEAIIDADQWRTFKAVVDEASGRTHWWMPYWESKPRGDKQFGRVGSVTDITIHGIGTPKLSARVTEMIGGKLVNVEFLEGDFLGEGQWTFEPVDGKTRVRYRWNVVPHRWLYRVLAPFINIGKRHSRIVQEGFKGLNRYLTTSQS